MKTLNCVLVLLLAAVGPVPHLSAEPEGAGQLRRVSIAYINDIHAQIEPHPELFWADGREEAVRNVGGLSRIATVFNELRRNQPGEVLFIDGGDTIQGSGPASWTDGRVVVEPMNALGLDLAIPGNWSVTYGKDAWMDRVAEFDYPMIAANMRDAETGDLLHEPYFVKELNGVRVGVIGFTEPQIPTRQPPHMSDGLAFDEASVIQPLVDELREEEAVDLVVIATHIGLGRAMALAREVEGEDIILSADTHERTYEPMVVDGTWIVEAGAFGSFVGKLDLFFDADGELADRRWRLIELRPELYPEDPGVREIVGRALEPHRERMNRVIGHTDGWLARYNVIHTSLDQVITDAILDVTGADVALSNGFRFSPPTAPGPITEADLWSWLPLNLRLKKGEATGAQFETYWEEELENVFSRDPSRLFGGWLPRASGLELEFDSASAPGERVRALRIGGQPLDPEKIYSVAAGARKGAPETNVHRVRDCATVRTLPLTTHDAVRKYLGNRSSIGGDFRPNLRVLDRAGVMRSQFIAGSE